MRDESSAMPARFAVNFIDGGVTPFIDLAKNLADRLAFSSGNGGYALNLNTQFIDKAKAAMGSLNVATRLDLSNPGSAEILPGDGFKCVNWLTFVIRKAVNNSGHQEADS